MPSALMRLMMPGTDEDVQRNYATLAARAQDARFGLFEDDVVVLDTETTGLSPEKDELIEIAAVRLSGTQITDTFLTYVDPGRPIPPEITRLTGITHEQVAGAPKPEEAVDRFASFAGSAPLVAHNAPFDQAFIERYAPQTLSGEWIDTLELARIALPRLRSHNLASLAEAFDTARPTHDAQADTEALAQIWRILLVALSDLPLGLLNFLAHLREETPWPLRPIFAHLAAQCPEVSAFDLREARNRRVRADKADPKEDAEGRGLLFPSPSEAAAGFEPNGAVGRMYPGYESRPEQVAMAREVAQAFADSTHRAIEAGTGVGKSIAYLYPAVLAARRNNITIGVSTRTNALMDQLVFHELPLLSEAWQQMPGENGRPQAPLRYCALKGYDHYPCLRKLERFSAEPPAGDEKADRAAITMVATLYAFAAQTSWGDLDSVPLHWSDLPRSQIACAPHDCLHHRCPYFPGRCYLHGVRNRAKTADIVVTNHALLFRNVVFENGILPPVRHWVVDEAHSVESEARRQLSPGISADDMNHVIDRLTGPRGALGALVRKSATLAGSELLLSQVSKVRNLATALEVVNESFWSFVKDLGQLGERSLYDRMDLWISAKVRESGPWGVVYSSGGALHKRLEDLTKGVRDLVGAAQQYADDIPSELAELSSLASQLYDLQAALGVILEGSDEHYAYSATIDRRPQVRAEALKAELLDVGEALVEGFYPEVHSVIYTSATIATASTRSASPDDKRPFAHFARAVGLDRLEDGRWRALRLESGYDFKRNMTIYLPSDLPAPTERGAYLPALERFLAQTHVAMGGSVLTLFTNRREMERAYDDLYQQLHDQGIEVICQKRGFSAKRLRDQFLDDEKLSLFALRSFWEGFDAPGDTLRCVVVTKLPFGRPTDPLSKERGQRDDKAWSHYTLPEAIIDFKQACGRLIRSSTDTGCLVLPDTRLLNKRYGRSFLDSLPAAERVVAPADQLVQRIEERFGG